MEAKKKAKAEDLKQNREENDYPEDSWPRCELCGEHPAEKKLPTDNDREFDVCLDCYYGSRPRSKYCAHCGSSKVLSDTGYCEQCLTKRCKKCGRPTASTQLQECHGYCQRCYSKCEGCEYGCSSCSPDSEKKKCSHCDKPLRMDKSGRYTFCECQALSKRSKEMGWLERAFNSVHTPPDRRYTNKMIFTRFYNKRQKEE